MNRWVGLVNLAQAAVYGAFGAYLATRWTPAGWMFYGAAGLQVIGGGALLAGKGPGLARVASIVGLVASAVVIGLHLQVGVHIVRTFTPVGGRQGYELITGVGAAAPWAVFFPIWQLAASRPGRATGAGTLVALVLAALLPPALTWQALSPTRTYASVDGAAAASFLFARWSGDASATPPSGDGPVLLVATAVQRSEVLASRTAEAGSLPEALEAIDLGPFPGEGAAVHLDVARVEGNLDTPPLVPAGTVLARPGADGIRGKDRVLSTLEAWSQGVVTNRQVAPGLSLPVTRPRVRELNVPVGWVRMDSYLASALGTVRAEAGWSAPPALSADAVREAALVGGHHLAVNMAPTGRFAYVVKGPSGRHGGGYNFPRHAGASWFLARLASRTGDAEIAQAARLAMDFLAEHTQRTEDGRAYVLDPTRRDGKVWVGTTALALLAFTEAGINPELQEEYARFIASAVDAQGLVRGDMDARTGTWPVQDEVTYAQGQGLLGLVAAERAGVPGVTDALQRAMDYVDDGYWPLPAANFHTLDEHWMCLAAAAAQETTGQAAGEDVCRAYLASVAMSAPTPGGPIQAPAGPAAGLAEAVIAQAELDRRAGRDGPYRQRALDYGELLLANLYQATDAPLVADPPALIGGFRDRPWSLDVRVDAVQHIACALLGVEVLLRDEDLPGGMP
ncbi:MAG: hypothetical protein H6739_06675 [Alphaproteobacteria bacterium]|nr:hypothetical protein [Alphaproteobacteria bacterium]